MQWFVQRDYRIISNEVDYDRGGESDEDSDENEEMPMIIMLLCRS